MTKSLWRRLFGGGETEGADAAGGEPWETYNGFRIRATPYRAEGQFQTAGQIEKDFPDGLRQHSFVRADKHSSRDDAVAFSLAKARQIVDEQGDGLFPRG